MNIPFDLQQSLSELLGDARLVATDLPGTSLKLWLIDAHNMDRAFTPDETRRILYEPPYWAFCWASGLALARYLAEHPQWVKGKRVLDFGAGSGWRPLPRPRPARCKCWRVIWTHWRWLPVEPTLN